jgi:ribosomal-protein-alanine N-acetyltransferase
MRKPSSTGIIKLRRAELADAPLCAAIHAASFPRGWESSDFDPFLAAPACLALLAVPDNEPAPEGLLLARIAADEAELITLCVAPAHRRRGLARALLAAAMTALRDAGARRLYLEVEEGNEAALGLYRSLGAVPAGRRPGYYAEGKDAAIFSLAL